MTVIESVFVVWLHDAILGIYASGEGAAERMAAYRRANPGKWMRMPSGRWTCYNPGGMYVSRLEVEIRLVEP